MDTDKDRCGSCGFLAKQTVRIFPHPAYSSIKEVTPAERSNPLLAYTANLQPENISGIPWEFICFRQAVDLSTEVTEEQNSDRAVSARLMLDKHRDCGQWCAYHPGLDPKDHLMERRFRELEDDRKAFQLALDGSSRKITLAAIILGSILGLAQVVTGLAQLTPESSGYKAAVRLYRTIVPAEPPTPPPPPQPPKDDPL